MAAIRMAASRGRKAIEEMAIDHPTRGKPEVATTTRTKGPRELLATTCVRRCELLGLPRSMLRYRPP